MGREGRGKLRGGSREKNTTPEKEADERQKLPDGGVKPRLQEDRQECLSDRPKKRRDAGPTSEIREQAPALQRREGKWPGTGGKGEAAGPARRNHYNWRES